MRLSQRAGYGLLNLESEAKHGRALYPDTVRECFKTERRHENVAEGNNKLKSQERLFMHWAERVEWGPKPQRGINVESQEGERMCKGWIWWVRHLGQEVLVEERVKSGLPGGEWPLAGDARLESPSLLTRYVLDWSMSQDNGTNKSKRVRAERTTNSDSRSNQRRVTRYILTGVSLDSDFEAGIPELLCPCWPIWSTSQQQVLASFWPYRAFDSSLTALHAWITVEPARKDSSKGSKLNC